MNKPQARVGLVGGVAGAAMAMACGTTGATNPDVANTSPAAKKPTSAGESPGATTPSERREGEATQDELVEVFRTGTPEQIAEKLGTMVDDGSENGVDTRPTEPEGPDTPVISEEPRQPRGGPAPVPLYKGVTL